MLFPLPPTVNKYEYTVSKQEPRFPFPVLSNNAISAFIAFIRCLLTVDALVIVGAAAKDDCCIAAQRLVSQEWKKAVATCSMVAGGLRSVTVSVWLKKSFFSNSLQISWNICCFKLKNTIFSIPKSRDLGFANPGIRDWEFTRYVISAVSNTKFHFVWWTSCISCYCRSVFFD